MSSREQTLISGKAAARPLSPKPIPGPPRPVARQPRWATVAQRAESDPGSLSPQDVRQLQRAIGNRAVGRLLGQPPHRPTVQQKPNGTGLPDGLKAGLENLSGLSMDAVRVHYNSARPKQLQALAYTQGTDIHLGPGQERHLPHEGWHAVQQMQGRVKPTMQAKDVAINDDTTLEREADVMGAKAMQMQQADRATPMSAQQNATSSQRKVATQRNSGVADAVNAASEGNVRVPILSTGRKVAQLRLSRQDAFALWMYVNDRYGSNPYVTAKELDTFRRTAVLNHDNLAEAKGYFDRVMDQFMVRFLQARYHPLLKAMTVAFQSGTGANRNNLFEVLVNLLLVQQGIRPAFLLQWIDYNEVYRPEIRNLIFNVINRFFEDGTFALKEIDQGVMVIDSLKLRWVASLVDSYEKRKAGAQRALGLALGYPAAGEIETEGQRYFAHILTPDGGGVMSNVCDSMESVGRFHEFYKIVRDITEKVLGIKLLFQWSNA